jgi:SAM-dependent methyltransferase
MSFLRKVKMAVKVIRQDGIQDLFWILISNYGQKPFPLSTKTKWKAGVKSEVRFWDAYFASEGAKKPEVYQLRFDPDLPLQPRPAALLSPQPEIHILDVGAGPLTYLGKVFDGKPVAITAVDPLADEYDRIFEKYQIHPLVRSQNLAAEELTTRFAPNTFDLVFARNCIDHAYDPEKAILQMVEVVKPGRYVLLEHKPNEAENSSYSGLHQWNFSLSPEGDFLISSKAGQVNVTKKYADVCTVTGEIVIEGGANDWLITRIQKK